MPLGRACCFGSLKEVQSQFRYCKWCIGKYSTNVDVSEIASLVRNVAHGAICDIRSHAVMPIGARGLRVSSQLGSTKVEGPGDSQASATHG